MLDEYGDFMSISEIAYALSIGRNKVYELLRTGKIKNFRIGKQFRVTRDAVVDYILVSQQR